MDQTVEKLAEMWRNYHSVFRSDLPHVCSMDLCNLTHIVGGVWVNNDGEEHCCVRVLCKMHPNWANRGTLKKQISGVGGDNIIQFPGGDKRGIKSLDEFKASEDAYEQSMKPKGEGTLKFEEELNSYQNSFRVFTFSTIFFRGALFVPNLVNLNSL